MMDSYLSSYASFRRLDREITQVGDDVQYVECMLFGGEAAAVTLWSPVERNNKNIPSLYVHDSFRTFLNLLDLAKKD